MKYSPRIEQALQIATTAHRNQNRKGNPSLPYISHPFSVFVILSEYTDNEDILIAGLLHDVLEDADPAEYNESKLQNIFSDKIISIIKEVSEQKDGNLEDKAAKENWDQRKIAYLEHLKTASNEALMISAADKIHNLICTLDELKTDGAIVWDRFNSPKEKQLWFYQEFSNIIKERGDILLSKKLSFLIQDLENLK